MISVKKLQNLSIILPKEPPKIEVPEFFPQLPGLFGYFACRGSGKSTAMTSLLRRYKEVDRAQRILVICPTYDSNKYLYEGLVSPDDVYTDANQEALNDILSKVESDAAEWRMWQTHCLLWEAYKKDEQQYIYGRKKQLDPELLREAVQCGIVEMEEKPTYKYGTCEHPVIHIVIDDCMSSQLFNSSTKVKNNLSNLCIKHRHYADRLGVTLHIALQAWKTNVGVLSRAIRSNLTCVVIWGIRDVKLMEDIHSEIGREISKEDFYKAYDYATSGEKWNALWVEFGSRVRLRRNLDTIIMLGEDNGAGKLEATSDSGTEEVDC